MENGNQVISTKKLGILEALARRDICEVKCSECGRHYVVNPQREPDQRFKSGCVEVFVYNVGNPKQPKLCLQLGAWRASMQSFELSRIINEAELPDLMRAFLTHLIP